MISKEDDAVKPVLTLAHQFDCVHGNEPTPQIMIQLIGCHVEKRDARSNCMENAGSALRRAGKRKTEYEKAQNDWNGSVSLRE
jgi:hypothetical protein